MDRTREICLALLRFMFIGEKFPEEYKNLTVEEEKNLYAFAKWQDISHIIAIGLDRVGITVSDEVNNAFRKNKLLAFYRSGIMEEEQNKIERLLDNEKIRFIPLKGAVLKKLYPEEWMRIGSDIDILVDEENIAKVEKLFNEKLSYKTNIKGNHDMGFTTPTGAHIEMHFKLIADGEYAGDTIRKVWEYTSLAEGFDYKYEMNGEFFYYYHLVHMAKHIKQGGCGIRFFIDLLIIEEKIKYDKSKLYELLEREDMVVFYDKMKDVLAIWMYGGKGNELTYKISEYVMSGGIYGNAEHHVALKQHGKIRKFRYLMKKIFIKKKTLAYFYPVINKYPILTPYYQIKRWFKIFDPEKRKRAKYELSINLKVKENEVSEMETLMEELGININFT